MTTKTLTTDISAPAPGTTQYILRAPNMPDIEITKESVDRLVNAHETTRSILWENEQVWHVWAPLQRLTIIVRKGPEITRDSAVDLALYHANRANRELDGMEGQYTREACICKHLRNLNTDLGGAFPRVAKTTYMKALVG